MSRERMHSVVFIGRDGPNAEAQIDGVRIGLFSIEQLNECGLYLDDNQSLTVVVGAQLQISSTLQTTKSM